MKPLFATILLLSASLPSIPDTARLVADWQITHLAEMLRQGLVEAGWESAVFYIGLARWAEHSDDQRYFDSIRSAGNKNNWQLGPRTYHADDQAIGQAYAAAYEHFGDQIEPMIASFNFILAHRPMAPLTFDSNQSCEKRWCWSDALFMAPASWFAVARLTKDLRYRDYADGKFWAAKNFLFDREDHLFYEDGRFFDQREPKGEKIFWGRGNGWVFAAVINILRELPPGDASRHKYETPLVQMAKRLITRQRSDGFWTPSLMSPPQSDAPEASCTAFFVYGLAAGINMGLLDRKRYASSALRGWHALTGAITSSRLGYVQQPTDRPGAVDPQQCGIL